MCKKWIIIGFNHPKNRKSILYKQNILQKTLLKTIEEGIEKGCNLFSIRGFEKEAIIDKNQKSIEESF